MKKIFLIMIGFILCSSLVFAEEPTSFSVLWSYIDSLHSLDWGSSYEFVETDGLTEMMTKLMNQNSKYEAAGRGMVHYKDNKDENIAMLSKAIAVGSAQLMDVNTKMINKLRKLSNVEEEGFKDVEYTMAEGNAQKKKAWEMIMMSAGFTMPIIMEFAKTDNPAGRYHISFRKKIGNYLSKG